MRSKSVQNLIPSEVSQLRKNVCLFNYQTFIVDTSKVWHRPIFNPPHNHPYSYDLYYMH
jgi:hypothetical protein